MTEPDTTADPVRAVPAPDDAVLDVLRSWAPTQRWFPEKDSAAALERIGVVDLPDPLGEAQVRLHLLALPSGAVLQVPTTVRADGPAPDDAPGVLGRVPGGWLRDGPHDAAFVRAWLAAAHDDGAAPTSIGTPRVVPGEQSNSSVLLPGADRPAILKVFRVLTRGPNPDVEVPLALTRAGWTGVPRPLAWLPGAWTGRGGAEAGETVPVVGHLGVLSELVQGAEDGFELACRYARDGRSFASLATDLGRTTAELHTALRRAIPVSAVPAAPMAGADPDETPGRAQARQVVATLHERAEAAFARVPELADRATAVHAAYDRLDLLATMPTLQRVHGDYHLGQVLRSGGRAPDAAGEPDDAARAPGRWYVLDFEGEPQAPAHEKTRPDLALRDLAGMLRSLDYAAAVGGARDPLWLAQARESLITGYEGAAGGTPDLAVILPALELDKALYEVVYESGNRPDWVRIPLAGVDRLLGQAGPGPSPAS